MLFPGGSDSVTSPSVSWSHEYTHSGACSPTRAPYPCCGTYDAGARVGAALTLSLRLAKTERRTFQPGRCLTGKMEPGWVSGVPDNRILIWRPPVTRPPRNAWAWKGEG